MQGKPRVGLEVYIFVPKGQKFPHASLPPIHSAPHQLQLFPWGGKSIVCAQREPEAAAHGTAPARLELFSWLRQLFHFAGPGGLGTALLGVHNADKHVYTHVLNPQGFFESPTTAVAFPPVPAALLPCPISAPCSPVQQDPDACFEMCGCKAN